jgi:tetratricopeptide (TPR) repeat protein
MPFGKKPDQAGNVIDFDQIYTSLIAPAIQAAGIEPLRWDDISVAGSISRAVLQQLLESDFVVADLSAGSPNIFYELGIRHSLRSSTTVVIARQGVSIPFDLAALRVLRYRLDESGRPEITDAFTKVLHSLLATSALTTSDSPVYQVLNIEPPRLMFRPEADSSAPSAKGVSGLEWKHRISEARFGGIDELRTLASEMTDVSPEVLLEMFKAYRSVGGWKEAIALAAKMPPTLASSPMVQEQLAVALNRIGESDRAEALLHDLLRRDGASSETYGILGRVYKDRWQIAAQKGDPEAPKFLDQAIESYVKGFEEDWRDYYPGINAVTLMDTRELPDPRREELIPVVRYAVKRQLAKAKGNYWDLATLLELEVLANAVESAKDILARIDSTFPAAWQRETTARNLGLIRQARERKGTDSSWIAEIETQLARKSN